MAAPVVGRGQGVTLALRPPLGFILRQTGRFRRDLANLEPLWQLFKPVMSRIEREQFDTMGHGEWPPLADSTLRQKAMLGFPPDPLIRTRTLFESLVDPAQAASTTRRSMTWGTDVEYAGFHQDGGSIPGRPPQREILAFRVEDRRLLEREMVGWINGLARRFARI